MSNSLSLSTTDGTKWTSFNYDWGKLAKICLVRVEEKGYHFNYKQHMDSIHTLPVCKKQYKIVVCMASKATSTLNWLLGGKLLSSFFL